MKKFLSILAVAFFMVSVSNQVLAQHTQGSITLGVTKMTSDDPNTAQMLGGFAQAMKTTFTFSPDYSLVIINIMGMFDTKVLFNNESSESLTLIDAMGQKYAVKGDNQAALEEAKNNTPEMKIVVNEEVTETIVGMKCVQVTISDPDNPEMKLVAYCTDEISSSARFIREMDASIFPGFPLKYTVDVEGIQITYEATEFTKKIDPSFHKLKTDGYEFVTQDELQKKLGGMGGGLGF